MISGQVHCCVEITINHSEATVAFLIKCYPSATIKQKCKNLSLLFGWLEHIHDEQYPCDHDVDFAFTLFFPFWYGEFDIIHTEDYALIYGLYP